MTDELFPSANDIRAHKSSLTKRGKTDEELASRASDISDLDQLCDFILQVAGINYRKGSRTYTFKIDIPMENLKEWAQNEKLVSKSMDKYDRKNLCIRLPRITKKALQTRVRPIVLLTIESCEANDARICLKVKYSILGLR